MIKNWNLFKESIEQESEIVEICKRYNIKNYTINDDLSIDVDDNVILSHSNLKDIPLKFNHVTGYFSCDTNKLTSLIGCPDFVDGYFSCMNNNLSTLEYLPKSIGGDFYCSRNYLTSLQHLPKNIGDVISCSNNKIWTFSGIPDNLHSQIVFGNNNPIYEIWKLFESVKDIEFFNDCHIIREPQTTDGLPIVVLERLNFFLETIGKDPVEKVRGYINI
jgi:hypothetical protein